MKNKLCSYFFKSLLVLLVSLVICTVSILMHVQAQANSDLGVWKLIDTVDYVAENTSYKDGSGSTYSMSENSIKKTSLNNVENDKGQKVDLSCSWTKPPAAIQPGEKLEITLGASVDELHKNRAGTQSAVIKAYIDDADIKYGYMSGTGKYLKDAESQWVCKAYGDMGVIKVGAASRTVAIIVPDGRDGAKMALMLSSDLSCCKKYIYQFKTKPKLLRLFKPKVLNSAATYLNVYCHLGAELLMLLTMGCPICVLR